MTAALVTAVVVLVLVVLCIAMVVMVGSSVSGATSTGDATTYAPQPTTRTTEPTAPRTSSRPADPTTDAPEPSTEPSDPTTEPTTAPTQEESGDDESGHRTPQRGYKPVPLPDFPASEAEAAQMAENSAIYGERVSNTGCKKMPNLYNRPYGDLSDKSMRNGMQVMANCAHAMWGKPTKRAGFQATKVKIQLYEGDMSSPCGSVPEGSAAGFYCSANQQIYMHRGLGFTEDEGPENFLWGHYLKIVTHEYGHHIQARTGVLQGEHYLETNSGSTDLQEELNRRLELQANCYAGMAMRRSREVERSEARDWSSVSKDSDTHGSADHRVGWALQGYEERDIYQCNTFRAPSSDVS